VLSTLRQSISRRGRRRATPDDYEDTNAAGCESDPTSPGTTVEMQDGYKAAVSRVNSMSAEEEYQELDIAS